MILVTGATGIAGAHIVRALLDRGEAVRAFVRDPARARFPGAEIAVGDLADAGSVLAAVDGVDVLVLSCVDDPRRVGWEAGAIQAARAAGVRRIVRLSSIGAAPGAPVAFWDWHGRADEQLRAADVPSTIVHAYPYMSNVFLGLADDTASIAMVDPRDVGAAVAAVAAEPGHDGATYTVSGPEAITYAQAAEALGVRPGDAPLPEPVGQLLDALRDGIAAEPTGAVEALTGRAPNGIAAFARETNKALIRHVFDDVIPSGDADAMRALMDPGFLDHDPLPGQPQGADGGAYVVRTMNRMYPGLRFTVHDLVAERDRVTIRWTLHGRGELSAIVVFRIAAGRIAERWAGWKPGFAPAHVPKLT